MLPPDKVRTPAGTPRLAARMPAASSATVSAAIFGLLVLWVFWLRWDSFPKPIWNVDEAIHATIARTLLDGGVLYRDGVDQRTPLSYYAVAGIFRIFGENNMWALHAVLAGMVSLTGFGLYQIGRRWHGTTMGLGAAAVFCALSTNLLYPGDAYALCTEWFVILFTTWSTWWFWQSLEQDTPWRTAIAGAGFALAFLSKQPALLDAAAPLLTMGYLLATRRDRARSILTHLLGFCLGWLLTSGAVFAYFAAKGALADFYFYAWTYNLVYYASATTIQSQLAAAWTVIVKLRSQYPLIGLLVLGGGLAGLLKLVQLRLTAGERARHPACFYLLAWTVLAWCAAASSGRLFDHYYIQLLPPFALLAGWLLADSLTLWPAVRLKAVRGLVGLLWLGTLWSVVAGPLRGPWATLTKLNNSQPAADFVRQNSEPGDRIFVWGFLSDFHVLADRRSASRFVYSSFLTGLVFTGQRAGAGDDSRNIVPGAMETLLAELEATRPEFIVDSSVDLYGHFWKYPIAQYPRLNKFIATHYVVVDTGKFERIGCKLYRVKDSGRRAPRPLAALAPAGTLDRPIVTGPGVVDPVTEEYVVSAEHSAGQLQRLELLVDGTLLESCTFHPTTRMALRVPVPFGRLGAGRHELSVRATAAPGEVLPGPPLAVECMTSRLGPERLVAFGLTSTGAPVKPTEIRAPYGAQIRRENNRPIFDLHAPSRMTYPLDGRAAALRGRFGFKPGAWAASNASATDGAEFVIELLHSNGTREVLLRRWLQPATIPEDRGEQAFEVSLPAGGPGGLIFTITNGPEGNPASDWTYWSDLLLINAD